MSLDVNSVQGCWCALEGIVGLTLTESVCGGRGTEWESGHQVVEHNSALRAIAAKNVVCSEQCTFGILDSCYELEMSIRWFSLFEVVKGGGVVPQ